MVHSKLLLKLLAASMPAIIVRLLLVLFLTQFANVRWCGTYSCTFSLKNGCKQGAVLSAVLYCVYVNGLFRELRKNKSGCWVGRTYLGLLGYSDDNFLLAPSRESLQSMLAICEKYAEDHGLKFSTDRNPNKSKTKCLAFLQKQKVIRPVSLCGNELPWVESCVHLGNTIVTDMEIRKQDVKNKRAAFINKTNNILQEFHFAHPKSRAKMIQVYNNHFYGSVLWNLGSKEVNRLEKSWNVAIRRVFNLPRESHCYLIEGVSDDPHVRTVLTRRFLSFIQSIRSSKKTALREVLRVVEYDTRSVTGRNLRNILLKTNQDDVRNLKPSDYRAKYRDIPVNEDYRVGLIKEIVEIKNQQLEVDGFNDDELDYILHHVCVS